MATRIHIPIDEADKARYRLQAEREGKSLAGWLREAAEDRIRAAGAVRQLRTVASLESFFRECDERETKPEPDWADHRKVIAQSRTEGLDVT
jgi:hypothetical protein